MANILICEPATISSVSARGSGSGNLLTPDPREVWTDTGGTGLAIIDIDLGVQRPINAVALCCLFNASPAATWFIQGGIGGQAEFLIQDYAAFRVPERAGALRMMSHALWAGPSQMARYIRIAIDQPEGAPLTAGRLIVGDAFQPKYNKEYGSGRGVKDGSTVTRLPSGSVAVVEGARYATYGWTLGDLSEDEADRLYEMQLSVGESQPVLVVEDPERTTALRNRIRYGALTGLRAFDRRNAVQTAFAAHPQCRTTCGKS